MQHRTPMPLPAVSFQRRKALASPTPFPPMPLRSRRYCCNNRLLPMHHMTPMPLLPSDSPDHCGVLHIPLPLTVMSKPCTNENVHNACINFRPQKEPSLGRLHYQNQHRNSPMLRRDLHALPKNNGTHGLFSNLEDFGAAPHVFVRVVRPVSKAYELSKPSTTLL